MPTAAEAVISQLPSRAATRCLRAFCLIVDARPRLPSSRDDAKVQCAICRFLLALYIVDVLSWVVFKVIQFEAIATAAGAYESDSESFPLSPVIFVTILHTLETTIEIGASAAVPLVFRLVEGGAELHPGRLAAFCMKVYSASALCALAISVALSPCILGGAVDAAGQQMAECEEATCVCPAVTASQGSAPAAAAAAAVACDLLWIPTNGTSGACCLRRGVAVEWCAAAASSSCPLAPPALAAVLSSVYCVFYCFMNQVRHHYGSRRGRNLPSFQQFDGNRVPP